MTDLIDLWLDQTYRAAGRSAGTIRARGSYLRTLARGHDILELDRDDLLEYLVERRALAPESRKSLLASLRSFYAWAHRRGLIAENPAFELPSTTVPPAEPRPVPTAVLERARAVADRETLLMLDLGALEGLRRSEIARVHADDVTDFGLVVAGKGGVVRRVPIHPRLRGRLAGLRGWAFPSPVRPGQPVTGDYVASRLEAVLPAPYRAHALRHYFASAAYAGTHDMRAVQLLLGHRSIETTQRYVAVNPDALSAAVSAVA